jgi:hypothetical protein
MSEIEQVPLLLLLVPPQHEVDPEALRELRRAVGDEYRAELWVRPFDFPAASFRLHLVGDWGRRTRDEVWTQLSPLIEASFYSLDWLEESA